MNGYGLGIALCTVAGCWFKQRQAQQRVHGAQAEREIHQAIDGTGSVAHGSVEFGVRGPHAQEAEKATNRFVDDLCMEEGSDKRRNGHNPKKADEGAAREREPSLHHLK